MIFESMKAILVADASLVAVVPATRVYFLVAPGGGAYPDIIQYPASGALDVDLEGTTLPWTRRISLECRAETYGLAHMIGDQVLRVLNNYVGTVAGEDIQGCHLVSDVPDVDENSAIKRRIVDFRVTHSPA
jgi:hypothetical protein